MFRTYNISNAIVNRILPAHRIVDNEYQWIINYETKVNEVAEEEALKQAQDALEFNFVPFSALDQYKHRTAEVDILALAIDIQPSRCVQTSSGPSCIREITLINEQKIQMLLTVWDELFENECNMIANKIANKPVLAAKRLRVVSYHNTSLSTKASSRLLVDPDLPETIELYTWWRDENEKYLQICIADNANHPSSSKVILPTEESITTISTVKEFAGKTEKFWIKANISIENLNQNFWYMACEKCHKTTEADFNELFKCDWCNKDNVKAIARCFIQVQCKDSSGALPATIFGSNAETFLHCKVIDLVKHTTQV
ncbi:Replication factor A protein [Trema orientale]|uniref:Replication factor A protein n=1 Tax=Trema orientale TaxID=63057 RepID=A0A2P5FX47_TREOI|nr:Replication factor A protein [Trema orientale]